MISNFFNRLSKSKSTSDQNEQKEITQSSGKSEGDPAEKTKSDVQEVEEKTEEPATDTPVDVTEVASSESPTYSAASTSRQLPQPPALREEKEARSSESEKDEVQQTLDSVEKANSLEEAEQLEESEKQNNEQKEEGEAPYNRENEEELFHVVATDSSLADEIRKTHEGFHAEITMHDCPAKISTVYVEKQRRFKQMQRTTFVRELKTTQKNDRTGLGKHIKQFSTFIPPKYRDVATAFVVQQAYHNASLITQGFLSGLTLAEAVFALNFATEELLLQGYRWMSLPVHIVFAVCFTFGCVSAFDRLGFYGWSREGVSKTLAHSGTIGVVLWSIGLISSVLCIKCDEELSPVTSDPLLTSSLLLYWRICCSLRAISASAAWLLLALRPDCNELGESIKRCVEAEVEKEEGTGE